MYAISVVNDLLEIVIDKDELDLDKTFNCGQAFRWNKQPSGEWVGVVNNRVIVLKQEDSIIYTNLEASDRTMIINYLNLDMYYTEKVLDIDLTDFEMRAYEKAKGIHILRQDLFETMVTFLMSSCNTMTNIRRIVESLCTAYGDNISTIFRGVTYNRKAFPTLEKLAILDKIALREFSMGFRAEYLYYMCEYLMPDSSFLSRVQECSYKDSIRMLKRFNGIGDKVANCIALFSLHHIDAFPIDTHINAIIQQEYNGHIDLSRYNGIAGIIQQYMFYYKAFS